MAPFCLNAAKVFKGGTVSSLIKVPVLETLDEFILWTISQGTGSSMFGLYRGDIHYNTVKRPNKYVSKASFLIDFLACRLPSYLRDNFLRHHETCLQNKSDEPASVRCMVTHWLFITKYISELNLPGQIAQLVTHKFRCIFHKISRKQMKCVYFSPPINYCYSISPQLSILNE